MYKASTKFLTILASFITIIGLAFPLTFGQQPTDRALDVQSIQVSLVDMAKWQSGGMGMGGMGGGMGTTTNTTQKMEEKKLEVIIKCKNTGTKQTNCIYWESRYLDTKSKLVVQKFKSKAKLKGGKTEDIKESMSFDTDRLPSALNLGYRITKIEYADNTAWESPDKDKDDDSAYIYQLYKF